MIVLVVGFSLSFTQWRTYPSGPPFFSAITLRAVVLAILYAALYYWLFALLAGGTRLVEPAQVMRWSWLTPAIVAGLAGPAIALLALLLTVLTGLVRASGVLGAG
ncbi:hypothetical protein [Quadrisphaera sp. DSM 44207]|uniref:hypothetical protein n=1 Tax=Quadrisphaera sp. DSM 44207 TaxID=1881057 RepID=UPI00115FB952|nr:hypothetical protein [Quadrisphaera sp. DSM 44207]